MRTATLVGRAWLYGLGALGQQGVALALDIMRRELAVTMALTGCTDVRAASRDLLVGSGDVGRRRDQLHAAALRLHAGLELRRLHHQHVAGQ